MKKTPHPLRFPNGFFWGAVVSAHQTEGGNHNDWTEWEKQNAKRLAQEAKKKYSLWQQRKFPEMLSAENYISASACDHYNRYEKDLDTARSLNLNAFRFSIEWSRIEPQANKFDQEQINHYLKVAQACRERNMEPFVTLWHWTLPIWLRDLGGIENPQFPKYFARYVGIVAEALKKEIKYWITLNEPTSVIGNAYLNAVWPPQKKSLISAHKAHKNLAAAHIEAYRIIRRIDSSVKIGFCNILRYQQPMNINSILDRLATRASRYFTNQKFFNLTRGNNDFLGVNFYFSDKISFRNLLTKHSLTTTQQKEGAKITDLGWKIFPEGIYHILIEQKRHDLPVFILENGLADAEDTRRKPFIEQHLLWIHKAIENGVNVCGYFYWSLIDNFEWDKGFWPRFGLVEVDYSSFERRIRPSALEYAKICKSNKLTLNQTIK